MRWKPEVRVEFTDGIWLKCGDHKKKVSEEDAFIVELMEKGTNDDKILLRCVMEVEEDNEILAGFRLAQFVVDYGDYLAEGVKNKIFDEQV